MRALLARAFAIDLRSLALLRIGLASMLLIDLADRARDLDAHYTDHGVWPRSAFQFSELSSTFAYWLRLPESPYLERLFEPVKSLLSIHFVTGGAVGQAFLFVLAAGFAVALLLGYRTRLATIVSLYLLNSLQMRNPLILIGADHLLRILLFWSVFLPLGARFSLDRLRHRGSELPERPYFSVATVAILLQVCFVYWFGAAHKISAPEWWHDWTAVRYALLDDKYVTAIGKSLLEYPRLLQFLTLGTLGLEALGPIAALASFSRGPLRVLVVAAFVAFHVGLGLCLDLVWFSHVSIVAWSVFVPAWFWDRVAALRTRFAIPDSLFERPGRDGRPLGFRDPSWARAFVGICLVYVLLWNLRDVDARRFGWMLPSQLSLFGVVLRIEQSWSMFSRLDDEPFGWYVIQGERSDGRVVDVLGGREEARWEKPELLSASLQAGHGRRWAVHLVQMLALGTEGLHSAYLGRYLCRRWNSEHPATDAVQRIRIYFVHEAGPHEPHGRRWTDLFSATTCGEWVSPVEPPISEIMRDEPPLDDRLFITAATRPSACTRAFPPRRSSSALRYFRGVGPGLGQWPCGERARVGAVARVRAAREAV